MNRQLTIKEIAPYLNYELNMYCGKLMDTYLIYPILGLANNEFYTYVNGEDDSMGRIWMDIEQYKAKPILYPLSSLTKEITHKGETFVPIEKIKELGLGSLPRSLDYKWLYYHQIEKLFEWHFDIFNLGENNLCIYYGDLNK